MPQWNKEQADETLDRFIKLIPELKDDNRLTAGVGMMENGVYVPYVCLKQQEVEGEMPPFYVMVLKHGEAFTLSLVNMIIIVGIGIPIKVWPYEVTAQNLWETIQTIWEHWFNLQTSLGRVYDVDPL